MIPLHRYECQCCLIMTALSHFIFASYKEVVQTIEQRNHALSLALNLLHKIKNNHND